MRAAAAIVMVLATAGLCLGVEEEQGVDDRTKLVVLRFAGVDEDLTGKVAMKFRYKFRRTGLYTVPSEIETDEAMAEAGVEGGYDASLEEVVDFARDYFLADVVIYGTVMRREMHYRMLRLSGEEVVTVRDEKAGYTDERSISFIVEKLIDELHDLDREMELEGAREEGAPLGENIVPNGDFEEGGERPVKWMDVDDLVVFYERDDVDHGMVMRFDTDVNLAEYQAWKAEREAGARLSAAPIKTPVTPPGYDTVGGTTGAPFRSDFFPVDATKPYRLTFEMKGPAGAKLFVKGYAKVRGELREVGRAYKSCKRKTSEGEWETFTRTFHPFRWGSRAEGIEALKIQLFAYWPRGTYSFDNIRIEEILPKRKGGSAGSVAEGGEAGEE